MTELIYGKDTTEGIVNVTLKDDLVYVYTESLGGVINCERFYYTPWVLSPEQLKKRSERLKGDQYYKYLTSVTCYKFQELQQKFQRGLWLPRNIEECFLLPEGVTYFKNRKIQDISILSFDIETNGLSINADSRVFLISNSYRKNNQITKKLFSIEDYTNESQMIEAWCEWVREVDPSIICGHNILSYDLPYLSARLHYNNKQSDLKLGRDESSIVYNDKTSKFRKDGSQQYDYYNAKITGREIIDTFFLSMKYDIGRNFPSYGLKAIVKHLGLEKEGRTHYEAGKIATYWNDSIEREKIKQYAIDDSEDSLKLFDLMAPAYFYMNQSIPKTFQQMINEASGSHLDALMIRSYLQNGYSQPKTSNKVDFEGAISMGIPGIYNHVVKADVVSLYPSIMIEYEIYDKKKDPNAHILQILDYFRTQRIEYKEKAQQTNDKYYDDLQNSFKILINSLYGFLGSGFLLYNYPAGGAEVTRRGREILQKGVEWATGHTLEKIVKKIKNEGTENEEAQYEWIIGPKISNGRGYTLTNVDTDSFSVTKDQPITKQEFEKELNNLNSIFPDLIKWDNDGIYDKVIVLRAKNYILCSKNNVKYKGSAITDQKKETALIEMIERIIKVMLEDKSNEIPKIYNNYVKEAAHIEDINRWVIKKTVTKPILNAYDETARLNERKPYLAIQDAVKAGVIEKVQEGDKIWLYNSVNDPGLKFPQLWKGDHDRDHYIKRIYDTMKILKTVVDMEQIPNYSLKRNKELLNMLTNVSKCDIVSENASR